MKKKVVRQIRILIPVCLISFLNGVNYTWFAGNYKFFQSPESDMHLTEDESSIMASLIHAGRLVAPFINVLWADTFGRKCIIIWSSLMALIGTTVQTVTQNVLVLETGRLIIGYSIGTNDGVLFLYLGEVASKKIRGIFFSLALTSFYLGISTGYLLGTYVPYNAYNATSLILSLIVLLSSFHLLESPYYLMLHGDRENALKNFSWLNDTNAKQTDRELDEMSSSVGVPVKFSDFLTILKTPAVYKSYFITSSLGVITSLISVTPITNANIIFPTSEGISSDQFAIFFSSFSMFAVFLSSMFIDRVGRRFLLMLSFSIQTIFYGSIASLFYVHDNSIALIPCFPWIMFAFITITFFIFSVATSGPAVAVRSELLPANFRTFGTNSSVILNGATNFVCTFYFLHVIKWCGMYANFLIFSACSLAGFVLVYCMLPETKGKTLYEIQAMLSKK